MSGFMSSSHRHRSHAHHATSTLPSSGKSNRVRRQSSSRASRLRAASSITPKQTIIVQPAAKDNTRRERLMLASRLRAASSITPKQTIIVQPAAKDNTRRERLMLVALAAVVIVDVLWWVIPPVRWGLFVGGHGSG